LAKFALQIGIERKNQYASSILLPSHGNTHRSFLVFYQLTAHIHNHTVDLACELKADSQVPFADSIGVITMLQKHL
jgi:hypothetical protein